MFKWDTNANSNAKVIWDGRMVGIDSSSAFNQEKALVGASFVIMNLRMELCFKLYPPPTWPGCSLLSLDMTSQAGSPRTRPMSGSAVSRVTSLKPSRPW